MIVRITVDGLELDDELNKYARAKLDLLDRYIPRRDRATTLVEVELHQKDSTLPQRTCALHVKLRREELRVLETTQHIYAALDIAVADMVQQLKNFRRRNPGPVRQYARRVTKRMPDDVDS